MSALLTDVWALSYVAGLLLGLVAFVFVFKHYRAAAEDEAPLDEPLSTPAPEKASPSEPVPVVSLKDALQKLPAVETKAAPAPTPLSETTLGKMEIKSSTGSVSPAVVYLQNLKTQMEHFEKEIQALQGELTGFVQRHDNQFDALLSRLGDLQQDLHQQVSAHVDAAAMQPVPAPTSRQSSGPVPSVVEGPKPQSVPKPAPKPVAKPQPAPVVKSELPSAGQSAEGPSRKEDEQRDGHAAPPSASGTAREEKGQRAAAPKPEPSAPVVKAELAPAPQANAPVPAEETLPGRRGEPVRIPLPAGAKSVPVESIPLPAQEKKAEETEAPRPAPAPTEPSPVPADLRADETLVLKPSGEMEPKKRGPVWPV
ncbi:MAG: hypothetical protein WC969_05670 [Elusimicrobiota bacterium]|jgi:hypothetical protein